MVGTCDLQVDLASFWKEKDNDCYGHWTDYAVGITLACCFPVVRFILDRTIFTSMLAPFLPHGKAATKDQQLTWAKAKESAWKFMVYVSFVALAIYSSINERWFTDPAYYWAGCLNLPCHLPTRPRVKLLYCIEMAYYLEEIPMLFIWSIRRKDFGQLLSHHIATLGLIVYSLEMGITRIGAIIYLLHDINDPFMELAKIGRYANWPFAINASLFGMFVLSWFITRVYIFPKVIIMSALFQTKEVANSLGVNIEPHYTILNGLLIFLFILHVYWSYLIVKIIIKQFTEGELDDVREKDD